LSCIKGEKRGGAIHSMPPLCTRSGNSLNYLIRYREKGEGASDYVSKRCLGDKCIYLNIQGGERKKKGRDQMTNTSQYGSGKGREIKNGHPNTSGSTEGGKEGESAEPDI